MNSLRYVVLILFFAIPTASAFLSAGSSLDEVALPRRTAEELGVARGDILEIGSDPAMTHPTRVRVAVIWDPPEHPAEIARRDLVVQLHLPLLERLLGRQDLVDRIVVRLKDPARAEQVRDDLNKMGRGYEAYTAAELTQQTSRSFIVISRFHRAIALITLLASGIFLVTLMSLKFTEIRREIGALRLVGVARGTILLAVLGLATTVALAGTVVGLGVGALLVRAINLHYQPLFATHLRFALLTPSTVWIVTVASLLLGIGAGGLVGFRLVRKPPLDLVGR
jgi:putative ABC transport system permease protein